MQLSQSIERLFLSSAAGRAAVSEQTKALDAKRAKKAAELDAIEAEEKKTLPALLKAEQEAKAQINAVLSELNTATAALREAQAARRGASNSREGRGKKIRADLRKMAPPELARFHSFLHRIYNELQTVGNPWGPGRREEVEKLLGQITSYRSRARELEESGTPTDEIRTELKEAVEELRATARKLGGFTREVMEKSPFDDDHEAAAA